MRILIAEDEKSLNRILVKQFTKAGYSVDSCFDGESVFDYLAGASYDALVLDVMMPKLSGFEVLERMRKGGDDTPVIFLTAKSDIEDKVFGLDSGANDYLTKPFSVTELLARLRVAQRRISAVASNSADSVFRNGGLTIDYGAGCVTLSGEEMKLTPTEYKLLCLLAKDAGKVLTHTYLTNKIWGSSWESDMASLRVHMATLRKKIEKDSDTQYIQTHIGIGYRMLKSE